MTITSTQNRVTYAGNGAPGVPGTLVFAVPFRFLQPRDLVVLVRVDATDVYTTMILDTHYSLAGEGAAAGGTVTFLIEDGEPQTGETLTIYGNPPMTQTHDFQSGDPFPAETHEEALDKLTLQGTRTREIAERAMFLTDSSTDGSGEYNANSNRISSLGTPTATTDATTKTYVDALVNNTALGPAPTGLIATGSVTSRLLADRWGEVKNVKDFGAVGDGVTDDTAAIQAAMDSSLHVYVPDGLYLAQGLVPSNNQVIEFQSQDAELRGSGFSVGGGSIFVTSGSVFGIIVKGGLFRYAENFWLHTGNSSLHSSRFEGIQSRYVTNVFDLSSSVGNVWEDCILGARGVYAIDRGIIMRGGTGTNNTNWINRCIFGGASEWGFEKESTGTAAFRNSITECWFESGTGGAINIGSWSRNTTIEKCYFEALGDATHTSPVLIDGSGGLVNTMVIDENVFTNMNADSDCAIEATGQASIQARNNYSDISAVGQSFFKPSSTWTEVSLLERNRVAAGGASYEDALFKAHQTAGFGPVTWTQLASSSYGYGTYHEQVCGVGHAVDTLDIYQPDTDVSLLAYVTVPVGSAHITDLTGAHEGQVLVLAATTTSLGVATRTVDHDAAKVLLSGGVDFVMEAGDTLSLLFVDGVWAETARSVNRASAIVAIVALDNTGTPTVLGGSVLTTGGTTTITDFDDGVLGQTITVLSEHAITITDGTHIILHGSADFVMAASDSLTLVLKADNKWYETARMVNL